MFVEIQDLSGTDIKKYNNYINQWNHNHPLHPTLKTFYEATYHLTYTF